MLEVEELTAAYGPVHAVDKVSLGVDNGSVTAVLGEVRSGKFSPRIAGRFRHPLRGLGAWRCPPWSPGCAAPAARVALHPGLPSAARSAGYFRNRQNPLAHPVTRQPRRLGSLRYSRLEICATLSEPPAKVRPFLGESMCLAPSQSQRDCVLQPRVARNELPWVRRAQHPQPQRGCGHFRCPHRVAEPIHEGARTPRPRVPAGWIRADEASALRSLAS